jgi:hypothetical protein
MSSEPLEPRPGEPIAGVDPGRVREVRGSELAVRFAFGAAVSLVAAMIGLFVSPKAGGMFLAFPAILPAALTLLEKKHDTGHAVHTVRGAVLGSAGMVGFAIIAALAFTHWPAALVISVAAAGWVVVSLSLYLTVAGSYRAGD